MTESEKKQLTLGLFMTTGAVLGAMLYQEKNFLFTIFGILVFYLAYHLVSQNLITKYVGYFGALSFWFVLYAVLHEVHS
ncbi:hypothetical protein GCM10023172_26490 [Hymenobacter ginsengisoli]|uniref:Apolipoprotein N-acyltransferase n=1 Tax=Hymenobacter ginsengisoli TaxID=1051626 RepID=A0ABP8QJG3_9BACT|nr:MULTISPECIES: hypothetical protein [unclassified Hymenobacter]MBO2030093.1 hypothetical protein [Hymenobacter sp. BT559]